jgi:hypothetical protein
MPIFFTLGRILIMGSKDRAICAVDSYRMHGQGSIPGIWHIHYVSFLFSGLFATFSPETSSLNERLNERFLTIWKHTRQHDNLYRQKTGLSGTVK